MAAKPTAQVLRALAPAVVAALVGWVLLAAFPPAGSARTAHDGILPPANPARSLALAEYLWPSCSGAHDYSGACLDSSLAMLNAGRLAEGLGPVVLPANWERLTIPEQLFVLSELERTARGLPPDTGLAADWNAAAQAGADAGQDPTHGGRGAGGFAAVWAGGEPNTLVVIADWVYADGIFPDGRSENLGCSAANTAGCWSHRDIILHDTPAAACGSRCAVGAAYSANGFQGGAAVGHDSYAEIFGIDGAGNRDPLMFTWAAERAQLPACERLGDSCSWTGVPVATASGIRNIHGSTGVVQSSTGTRHGGGGGSGGGGASGSGGGGASGSGGGGASGGGSHSSRPRFTVRLTDHVSGAGHVSLMIRPRARLIGLRVIARLGRRHVALRVRRRSRYVFRATGRLRPGRWWLLIRYHTGTGRHGWCASRMRLTVRGAL